VAPKPAVLYLSICLVKAVRLTKWLYSRLKLALPVGNGVGKVLFIIKEAAYLLIGVVRIVESLTPFC
jgi:hypothetical protein